MFYQMQLSVGGKQRGNPVLLPLALLVLVLCWLHIPSEAVKVGAASMGPGALTSHCAASDGDHLYVFFGYTSLIARDAVHIVSSSAIPAAAAAALNSVYCAAV